jgi:hypothetical protein
MAKAKARPEEEEPQGRGRIDSVKPPDSLPDASPLERMSELARRLINVPKREIGPTARGPKPRGGKK